MKPLLLKYDLGQKIKEYGTWELAATPYISVISSVKPSHLL
jgi:hypothetical protein